MRRTVLASTSTSVCPPVNPRAAVPVMTTFGISPLPAPATPRPDPSLLLRGEAGGLLLVERPAPPRRRPPQVAHADAHRVRNRLCYRGQRRQQRQPACLP